MQNSRLLVLINNYQGENSVNTQTDVERVIETFASYRMLDVDIVMFSTRPHELPGVVNLVYPADLGHAFAYVPRQWLAENFVCLGHDFFLYTENDLITPEVSTINCIANNDFLGRISPKLISGFIRFETDGNGAKRYIDMLPHVRPTVEKIFKSKEGRMFWLPGNLHSGSFLLSRKQLGAMLDNKRFQIRHAQYGKQYYGILESAATDVYLDFVKLLPQDFRTVEIEHVSNRYDGLAGDTLSRAVGLHPLSASIPIGAQAPAPPPG
jgi:hypothetical protein